MLQPLTKLNKPLPIKINLSILKPVLVQTKKGTPTAAAAPTTTTATNATTPPTIGDHTNPASNEDKDKTKQITPTICALLYNQVRTGIVAPLHRASTSTTNIPISLKAPLATNIGTNTSQNIPASTTTTTAAAPIPTVHDSTVLQTTNKRTLPTYFGLHNLNLDIQISHFSTTPDSSPQQT